MAPASLLTLPVEIRLAIWEYVIPQVIEVLAPSSCDEAGEHIRWEMPQNPRLPFLLTNKQLGQELVDKSPPTTLIVRCHEMDHLCKWLETSTLHDKKLVGRIRIENQEIEDIRQSRRSERRASAHEWWVNNLANVLVYFYRQVKLIGSELTCRYHQGYLDAMFEVRDCHDLKTNREFRRYESGVMNPLRQTVRVTAYNAGDTELGQNPIEVIVGQAQGHWWHSDPS